MPSRTGDLIELHNLTLCQLPYINLPELPGKFLLDSGSSKSLIKPQLAYSYCPDSIYQNPFEIKTAHGTSTHTYRSDIILPSLSQYPHEFCLFNFNDKYSGLIGADFLVRNKAKVDFGRNKLCLPHAEIDLEFPYQYTLEPNSQTTIQIPVDKVNGSGIVEQFFINNAFIPDCLITANQGQANVNITNPTSKEIKIRIDKPAQIVNIDETYANNMSFNTHPKEENSGWIRNRIRKDHLNEEEEKQLMKLCTTYSDIFANEKEPLTSTNVVKHRIRTKDDIPVHSKLYRYPAIHKEEVENQIEKMLRQNIIRHSHSPWCSPIWVVPKKEDASGKKKWRIVVDYRKLNDKTIPDRFPIPKIEEILDRIGRSQYFTTIDLVSGFHQIEIHPDDVEKTAFSTDTGHYEYLRMPFGLNNAPATFQRLMNNVLHGLIGKTCLVYMDDVVVFSTSLQEHIEKLKQVFERFRMCRLKVQLDKTEFLKKEAEFLGHIITPEGIKPNPKKLQAIEKYPIPKTTKQIKSFLGLIGYYRKFIKDFAKITKPITKCLKKNAIIDPNNSEYIEAFEMCKHILMNSPLLQSPDFSKPFILTTDASNFAIGAILSQGTPGSDKPVAYASRTLNDTENKYSTIEKELLAIIWAVTYFRPYLYGRKFLILTDHKPLKWLFSLKEPNQKLIRWRLKLEEYDYEIDYKKGKNNNADALSRIEINPIDIDSESMANNLDEVEWIEEIKDEPVERDAETVNSNHDSYSAPGIPILEEESINSKTNQIFFRHSLDDPRIISVRKDKRNLMIAEMNLQCPGDIIQFIQQYCIPQRKYYCLFSKETDYEKVSSIINQHFNNEQAPQFYRCMKMLQEITSEEDLKELIEKHHEGKTNHRGVDETYLRLKKSYYYPNLKSKIDEYIQACEFCKMAKYNRHPVKIALQHTNTPTRPMEALHADTFQIESSSFLTLIDPFSKFCQAYHIRSKNAIEVNRSLVYHFSQFGTPKSIVTDSGTEFTNATIKELLESYHINLHTTTPSNPNSNGPIERLHSTLIEHYRLFKLKHPNLKPHEVMPYCVLAYNSSIHSQTLKTPFELIFGYDVEIPNYDPEYLMTQEYNQKFKHLMKIVYHIIHERIEASKDKTLARTNKDTNQPFNEGDIVYKKIPPGFHKKHKNPFSGPYTIVSLLEHNKAIILNHKTDEQTITHLSNLRLSGGPTESNPK